MLKWTHADCAHFTGNDDTEVQWVAMRDSSGRKWDLRKYGKDFPSPDVLVRGIKNLKEVERIAEGIDVVLDPSLAEIGNP